MNVLVIGATGQLGANLVRALLEKGDQVRVLIRSASKSLTLDGLDVERVAGDLNDLESLRRACDGVQIVYQTASYYPRETIPVTEAKQQALTQTKKLLEAVRSASVARIGIYQHPDDHWVSQNIRATRDGRLPVFYQVHE